MEVTTRIPDELDFIGCGNAFSVELGNTSAFFTFKPYEDSPRCMVLIDCGNTVPQEIIRRNILDDVEKLLIIITHMHGDHVGGLPTLLDYCKYVKNVDVMIMSLYSAGIAEYIYESDHKYYFGEKNILYKHVIPSQYNSIAYFFNSDTNIPKIQLLLTEHTSKINGTCVKITWVGGDDDCIYYIADTAVFPQEVIHGYKKSEAIHSRIVIYMDMCTTKYPDEQVHLYYKDVLDTCKKNNIDPYAIRCMHLESLDAAMLCGSKGFALPDWLDKKLDNHIENMILKENPANLIRLHVVDYTHHMISTIIESDRLTVWLKNNYPDVFDNVLCKHDITTFVCNDKYTIYATPASCTNHTIDMIELQSNRISNDYTKEIYTVNIKQPFSWFEKYILPKLNECEEDVNGN